MGLLKKKRIRTWCSGGGRDLGFEWSDKSRKTKPEDRKVKFIRCSVCGQRFEALNRECHDAGCVHQQVPPHKAY